jgi:hypothetical protein
MSFANHGVGTFDGYKLLLTQTPSVLAIKTVPIGTSS